MQQLSILRVMKDEIKTDGLLVISVLETPHNSAKNVHCSTGYEYVAVVTY